MIKPTHQRLDSLLSYDPEIGSLLWKVTRNNNAKLGDHAGSVNNGYIYVYVDGMSIAAHRIAWMLFYGEWPKGHIDHINTVKNDNRIHNLRVVTRSQNLGNQRVAHRTSKTGVLGVTYVESRNRYVANIQVDGVKKTIGYYKDIASADAAYKEAKAKMHGVIL